MRDPAAAVAFTWGLTATVAFLLALNPTSRRALWLAAGASLRAALWLAATLLLGTGRALIIASRLVGRYSSADPAPADVQRRTYALINALRDVAEASPRSTHRIGCGFHAHGIPHNAHITWEPTAPFRAPTPKAATPGAPGAVDRSRLN